MGQMILPALADVHVHFRDPGGTHKEDFATGTQAALAGGIVVVLDMPNTSPPTISGEALQEKARIAEEKAHCDFGLFLGAGPDNAAAVAAYAQRAAGLKMYLGHTFGPLLISDLPAIIAHFQRWKGPGPIAIHAEGPLLAAAIALARAYDQPTHLCHVSRAEEIALIRRSKAAGAPITCEVTPHHLFLTQADARRLGPFAYMKPTLGSEQDQAALWKNLDIIDCFATDHAPHTRQEKLGENPPPGVPGLETMLPLLLTAVHEGRLTLEDVVERLHDGPARVYHLPMPAAQVEVDPDAEWEIADDTLQTRCGWTPFAGMKVRGRVRQVFLRGTLVYQDGKVLAPAGFGRNVFAG